MNSGDDYECECLCSLDFHGACGSNTADSYATDFSDASRAALPLVSTIARQYGSQVYVVNI
jgi:hypothetical protein